MRQRDETVLALRTGAKHPKGGEDGKHGPAKECGSKPDGTSGD